jgi:cytochrome c biogenesis protein CcdA
MSDSLIIYRNPMEKAFWENGGMFYVIIFAISMGVTFVLTYFLLKKFCHREYSWFAWVSGIIGITVGILACVRGRQGS